MCVCEECASDDGSSPDGLRASMFETTDLSVEGLGQGVLDDLRFSVARVWLPTVGGYSKVSNSLWPRVVHPFQALGSQSPAP